MRYWSLILATLEYSPYITQVDKRAQGLVVDASNTVFARIGRPIQIGSIRLHAGNSDRA